MTFLLFTSINFSCLLGYVDIGLIPKGARGIKVMEVTESGNFLAMRSKDPEKYYLNGGFIIQWNGEYKVAGTIFQYDRTGDLENLTAPGPTNESIWIQVKRKSGAKPANLHGSRMCWGPQVEPGKICILVYKTLLMCCLEKKNSWAVLERNKHFAFEGCSSCLRTQIPHSTPIFVKGWYNPVLPLVGQSFARIFLDQVMAVVWTRSRWKISCHKKGADVRLWTVRARDSWQQWQLTQSKKTYSII